MPMVLGLDPIYQDSQVQQQGITTGTMDVQLELNEDSLSSLLEGEIYSTSILQPDLDYNQILDEFNLETEIIDLNEGEYSNYSLTDIENQENSIDSFNLDDLSLDSTGVGYTFSEIPQLVYSNNKITFPCNIESIRDSIDIQLVLSSSSLIYLLQTLANMGIADYSTTIVAKRNLLSLDWLVDIPKESYYAAIVLGIINDHQASLTFVGDVLTCQKLIRHCQNVATIVFDNKKIQVMDIHNLAKFSDDICDFTDDRIKPLPINHFTAHREHPIDKIAIRKHSEQVQPKEEKMKTVKLILAQREVSSLIGIKGHRLNSIRIQSRCLIKVLPINQETPALLSRREKPQELLIQGTESNVAIAVHEINTFVSQQRLNNNKFR
ncbi:uncharacterized protein SPAPADRAFT_65111 [Spathaspora passalidarum NRRL Y-27907]|uniref:K Homology domain-containing protein n=1 Tax=Spathaspora passalidarum (strain NRRL Y-27907 / 11-Y1) TaxID=619300 RepID=G3AJK3_SPAPN|nr:uncharacterized protein SPAPADRAFT_65111 [Spathaspora passalidarum NRRL Y-27907]EGW33906.1 hypothetical protein SPAPADRAFT_65111 [Spathaspora passalidarum NRRL Y-27907]